MRHVLFPFLIAAAVAAQAPSFDVVSIKPNKSGSGSMTVGSRGDRWVAVNATTLTLVMNAYSHETFNIVAVPAWMKSERYDVTATSSLVNPTREQYQAMVRALLAERFKLVAHTEVRELPTYRLVRASGDGAPGPRLRRTDVDCDAIWSRPADAPRVTSPVTGMPVCTARGGMGTYASSAVTMEDFARTLSYELERKVTDGTGLEGRYDLLLQFTPEERRAAGAPDEFGTIFTALLEQLGLKLEARRGPVEVLVIDRVERPSEN